MSDSTRANGSRATAGSNVPVSLLDTDLYKLTMQNAVFKMYPDAHSEYKFTNRAPEMLFSRRCYDWVKEQVQALSNLRLLPAERQYLEEHCPYFHTEYLNFVENLKLDPENQVQVTFKPQADRESSPEETAQEQTSGDGRDAKRRKVQDANESSTEEMGLIEMDIQGPWRDCILYEVPLMSILSEGYFRFDDTDWDEDYEAIHGKSAFRGVKSKLTLIRLPSDLAKQKTLTLLTESSGCILFSEFGTRRRRSYKIHDAVVKGLIDGDKEWTETEAGKRIVAANDGKKPGGLAGTSNVFLAMQYGLRPVGTIAHEWIMAIGAKEDYDSPNLKAMDAWEKVYPANGSSPLHTMLTDTYTIKTFFDEFTSDSERALRWNGLRHDSGDPLTFARAVKDAWTDVAAKSGKPADQVIRGKKVIFSDGLDVPESLRIWRECEKIGIDASFGIGTNLTNDFKKVSDPETKSKPLNIVIKLRRIDGLECVKLTDDKGKYTGKPDEVSRVLKKLKGEQAAEEAHV